MNSIRSSSRSGLRYRASWVALLALASGLPAQGSQGGQAPTSREAMWPAPTAEDWARPCLITWQRTYQDAVAVSKETGKALLLCINMDGEIASEHYAGIRYRQPEITKLYEPYVTVIASVYRHNPRDHDEQGNRIPCPRFGGVTCGEHIAIEPILYEKFLDGRRIAPRHIMVELDGAETYDVFYAFDTDSVFKAISDGITNRPPVPLKIPRGDRSIVERVASHDSQDRAKVERAYAQGNRAQQRALLEAAISAGDAASIDLLRLAVFGLDLDNAKLARRALAKSSATGGTDLINEALRVPMPQQERDGLVAALTRIGAASPRARTLAVVHQGLGTRSSTLADASWSESLAGAEYPSPTDWDALGSKLDTKAQASVARPDDAAARLELAAASLALAVDPKTAKILSADARTASKYSRLMYEDARRAALQAEKLGAKGWRLDAIIAIAAANTGDMKTANARAAAAVANMPPDADEQVAVRVLTLFAHARQRSITKAVVAKKNWPPQWLTDLDAAYSVLARHPLGNDGHIVDHYDFLKWLGGKGKAARVLTAGLGRFPDSWILHDRLRGSILAEKGVRGLEPTYEAMLAEPGASPNLSWFAGYTSIVAAEFHRRRGRPEEAVAVYGRAIGHYQRTVEANPTSRENADHYIALALGGLARLAFERGDYDDAAEEVLASFRRRPDAAATLDGLNISAVGTAQMLLARLQELTNHSLASKVQAGLDALDPALLELPAFERETPPGGTNPGRGQRRGRRGR